MKHIIACACLLALTTGCLNKQFVKAVDGYTQVILPEYKAYVDGDKTITDETKRIRKQTAEKLQDLVDEASK